MRDQADSARGGRSGVVAILALAAVGLALVVARETAAVDASLAKRALGALLGGVLVIAGNYLPTLVPPLAGRSVAAMADRAAERFAGWVSVLAGVACSAVWLFAPIDVVKLASSLIVLGAFGISAAHWARRARTDRFDVDTEAKGHSA
jgi:hypothetical protein